MNYDTVILEMLSRIQKLEEEVRVLKRENGSFDDSMSGSEEETKPESSSEEGFDVEEDDVKQKVSTSDIRDYIEGVRAQARANGEGSVTLRATDVHNALRLNQRYPMVCNAMRQCMRPGDVIVHQTESGYSSSLEIRYNIKGE